MREQFLVNLKGKQFVTYEGLLDESHNRKLVQIEEEILQIPSDENGQVAIVKAVARTEDGKSYSGIGDASPENVSRNIAPHKLRMASTRAKARALRDLCNIGVTALEELGDDDAPPQQANVRQMPQRQQNQQQSAEQVSGPSEKQKKYLKYLISQEGEDIGDWEKANKPIDKLSKHELSKAIDSLKS